VGERLGRVPDVGDRVELATHDDEGAHRKVALTVDRMDGLRVDRVGLELLPAGAES
jgi:CBS domain containing-hemolysin-like protein